MAGEKYRMFKQFMHNELGITKEDIREWVKESVREEAERMVVKTYENFDVKLEIRNMLLTNNSFHRQLASEAVKEICKHVKLIVDNPTKEE